MNRTACTDDMASCSKALHAKSNFPWPGDLCLVEYCRQKAMGGGSARANRVEGLGEAAIKGNF